MARDSKGSWIAKNSHCITNKADHSRRSFVVKTLHGNAPVMMRQGEWYPDAYPESEMFLCLRGCGKTETQAHMLTCSHNSQIVPTTLTEIAKKWNANAAP
ncbi:hypothetical protein EV175_007060, partial [Coemansia sp. RSA 1933]